MRFSLIAAPALVLAAALPGVAHADSVSDELRRLVAELGFPGRCEPDPCGRVWVEGHYERRDCRRVVPAVARREWVPERCEEVVIPAVTERTRVPALTERVFRPPVVERVWCPEVRERVLVPGHYDDCFDSRGRCCRVFVASHWEERVVCPGRYEERVVRPGCWETRVVRPECWEVRAVCPERRERRVVEPGCWRTVVVCPERTEVTHEVVWVPGHFETRPARARC